MRVRVHPVFKIALLGIVLTQPALADWSSGGGFLSRDKANPWWMKNTKTVRYCVQIDEQNFGVSQAVASQRVREAIRYWKESFSKVGAGTRRFGVAAQEFILSSNCQNTQLRFQLGHLTELQEELVGKPSSFVGVAFREEYSPKHMKSKGFIYVSPQAGRLKMTGPNLLKKPWALNSGSLLRLVLIHELGHVFGVQHGDALWPNGPELMVSKTLGPFYANMPAPVGSHFTFRQAMRWGFPRLPENITQTFNVPDDTKCVGFSHDIAKKEIEVYRCVDSENDFGKNITFQKSLPFFGAIDQSSREKIGTIPITNNLRFYKAALWLYPPKGQVVFEGLDDDSLVAIAGLFTQKFSSEYVSLDGTYKKSLSVTFSTSGMSHGDIDIVSTDGHGKVVLLDL